MYLPAMREPFAADADFRPLTPRERDVIKALLVEPFAGRHEVAEQVEVALGRSIDDEGSLALSVPGTVPAPVLFRVPVEGVTHDPDGMPVHILLHVVDGYVDELDVFREDSGPRLSQIDPARITVTALPVDG
jgi:hypothetical protein